jgi:hypothetical protein
MAIGGLGVGTFANTRFIKDSSSTVFQKKGENDFRIRGFHVDLRVEIMTIKALKKLASTLASLSINTLILEYTASYPFQKNATISGRYAYSRNEIKDFLTYCDSLGIQVIPLLENLGHVQYILRHARYAGLRIERSILSMIDPLNKDAIPLFRNLIEDMVSLHPSKYIHVGGDEAEQLHNKKFTEYIKRYGVSKLYTQYMKQICQIAIDKGKTPLLWADMILKYPQAVEDLPIDQIIFIDWNYGWRINKFGNIIALQKKGCTFWGAPALRSSPDNYFITRWENHFDNLKVFIPYARRADYSGIIMTSWSTSGVYAYQWQGTSHSLLKMFPLRNVYPLSGFNILIAAYSQALKSKGPIDPKQFVTNYGQQRFGFSEKEGNMLWNYLAHRQVIIGEGKAFEEKNIERIRKKFHSVSEPVYQLNPTRHQQEFEQFKLMGDIRDFYLAGRQVESIVESTAFDRSKIDKVKNKLEPLVKISKKLDRRFITLNKGYLHDGELDRLNDLRNERLKELWNIYNKEI